MLKIKCRLGILFVSIATTLSAQHYNIRDFGAKTDSQINNAPAIQRAIETCAAAGGGSVIVPAGTFFTGTIHLKTNINLHLEAGAILKGSPTLADYEPYTMTGYGTNYYGIVYTADAENVSITGEGVIDGNNSVFFDFEKAKTIDTNATRYTRQKTGYRKVAEGIGDGPVVPKDRPRQMVIFSHCQKVRVQNLSLLNSPFWTLHFADCDGVQVSGIRLWSGMLIPNADGIDVTSCSNVIISDCDIRAGDDALAIVGYDHHFEIPGFRGLRHISENILVSNCNLQSSSSGIRIGFLDQNTVRNVHVSHVNITNSTRGIGIFLRDEGSLENIHFDDMTIQTRLRTGDWWGNGEPIHISAVRGKENVPLGTIKDIQFHNITCVAENGILIYGSAESNIHDIRFDNVSLELVDSRLNAVAGGNIDLRGCLDPRQQIFQHDIPGLYANYVEGLVLTHCRVYWQPSMRQSWFREAIRIENFNGVSILGCTASPAPAYPSGPSFFLENGRSFKTDLSSRIITKNVSK